MVEPIPLNRLGDLRTAQALADQLASRLGVPVLSNTVERLADILQAARVERQAAIAAWRAEFESDIAELRMELAEIRGLFAALQGA
jgi:fido (protein-threonine AMPylation protein)